MVNLLDIVKPSTVRSYPIESYELGGALLASNSIQRADAFRSFGADQRAGDEEMRAHSILALSTFLAGDPNFMIPQMGALVASLKNYLSNHFPRFAMLDEEKVRKALVTAAIVVGGVTAVSNGPSLDVMAPLGITALSVRAVLNGHSPKIEDFLKIAAYILIGAGGVEEALDNFQVGNTVNGSMQIGYAALSIRALVANLRDWWRNRP